MVHLGNQKGLKHDVCVTTIYLKRLYSMKQYITSCQDIDFFFFSLLSNISSIHVLQYKLDVVSCDNGKMVELIILADYNYARLNLNV